MNYFIAIWTPLEPHIPGGQKVEVSMSTIDRWEEALIDSNPDGDGPFLVSELIIGEMWEDGEVWEDVIKLPEEMMAIDAPDFVMARGEGLTIEQFTIWINQVDAYRSQQDC